MDVNKALDFWLRGCLFVEEETKLGGKEKYSHGERLDPGWEHSLRSITSIHEAALRSSLYRHKFLHPATAANNRCMPVEK
jgi:hypothetical protein